LRASRIGSVALVLAFVFAGCAGTQHFDAAERATGLSPQGYGASEYDIWGATGNVGQARVWAPGAYEAVVDGREMTVIEVVLELENNGTAPMVLSAIRLDSADADGAHITDLSPVRIEGPGVVAPGDEERVRAYFAIPERYDPDDIADFRVRWAVRQGERTYAQRTPFLQAPDYYYDPYLTSPFLTDPFLAPGAQVFMHPYAFNGPPAARRPMG
jgi:hypothetical protein